jgi:alkaline phosphatase
LFKPKFNFGDPAILDKLYAQQRSYHDIFAEFNALPADQQTAKTLVERVNHYTSFTISETDAVTILKTQRNNATAEGSAKTVAVMPVHDMFYKNDLEKRENLLAQAVATQQSAVWATGTHTSTPVYVFTQGPKHITDKFKKILHHTELGQLALDALQCSHANAVCNQPPRPTNVVE